MLTETDLIKIATHNPYNDDGCPICGEHAVDSCRCMGPHSLDKLASGHGLRCINGHRWSREVAFDPNSQKAAEEIIADPANVKSPVRKVYDTVANGAAVAAGAIGAGIAGIQSMDNKSPVKKIE